MSNRIKKKYMAGKTYFDYPTLFLVIFLICFGMVMIYSTSSYKSMMTYGNSYKWVLKQGLVVLGGAIAIFLISRADYRIIKGHKPAFLCLGIATFSMIVVLLVGAAKKGSVRWISIAGFQIQPSEFCKFLLASPIIDDVSDKEVPFFHGGKVWCMREIDLLGATHWHLLMAKGGSYAKTGGLVNRR